MRAWRITPGRTFYVCASRQSRLNCARPPIRSTFFRFVLAPFGFVFSALLLILKEFFGLFGAAELKFEPSRMEKELAGLKPALCPAQRTRMTDWFEARLCWAWVQAKSSWYK